MTHSKKSSHRLKNLINHITSSRNKIPKMQNNLAARLLHMYDNNHNHSSSSYAKSISSTFSSIMHNGHTHKKGKVIVNDSRKPYLVVDEIHNNDIQHYMLPKNSINYKPITHKHLFTPSTCSRSRQQPPLFTPSQCSRQQPLITLSPCARQQQPLFTPSPCSRQQPLITQSPCARSRQLQQPSPCSRQQPLIAQSPCSRQLPQPPHSLIPVKQFILPPIKVRMHKTSHHKKTRSKKQK